MDCTLLASHELNFETTEEFQRNVHRTFTVSGPGSSVGIATDYGLDRPGIVSRWGEIFRHPDRPWGPPSLLYNGYRVFPRGRMRPGRDADRSPLSSAEVLK